MSNISTALIIEAVNHYTTLGYKVIDVPQCVDFDVSQHTKPEGVPELFHRGMKVYVASAEQSFLQLHKEGKLPDGKYVAMTPCYRHEALLDDTHFSMFLKVELISVGEKCSCDLRRDASAFFLYKGVFSVAVKTTEEEDSWDLESSCGVELGSYGVRYTLDGTPYTYGTGVAEPRFSAVMNKRGK
jgi:hypothetical protein